MCKPPVSDSPPGWMFGSTEGRSGLFPGNLVQPAAAPDFSFSEQPGNRRHKSQLGEPGLAQWSRVSEVRKSRGAEVRKERGVVATPGPGSVPVSPAGSCPGLPALGEGFGPGPCVVLVLLG